MTENTQWNLLPGSKDWSQGRYWSGIVTTDVYNGCTVLKGTLPSSDDFTDLCQWPTGAFSELPQPSTDYTLSFWAKASEACSIMSYFYPSIAVGGDGNTETRITTEWQRYEVHWTTRADIVADANYVLPMRLMRDRAAGITAYIAGCKFERSDTATPWCGTFEEERTKAIAAREGTYNSRLTLTALRTVVNYTPGGNYATPSFTIEKADVPYINLQWNRSLYEAGTFEVQLAVDNYSSSYSAFTVTSPNESYGGAQAGSYSCDNYPDKMAYGDETRHGRICTATGHYEIGLILKTRFITKSGQRYVLLSGLMLDALLDGWSTHRSVAGTQSVETALYNATQIMSKMSVPLYQWLYLKLALATAEDKALAPTIATKDYTPSYSIVSLGDHFRTLLESRSLGLAATCLWNTLGADYTSNSANSVFFVKAGVDRTLQSDNPVLIGCAFGNVASEEVTVDDSSLRDGITGYVTYQSDGKNLYAVWKSENQDKSGLLGAHWTRGYLTETNLYTAQDATTEADAIAIAKAYGENTLQDYIEERTAELDVSLLSVEEFNSLGLGDLVTVYLDATSTFETMRIVGFSEVCKEGGTTRSITLGTKRLTNNVRAAKYAAL